MSLIVVATNRAYSDEGTSVLYARALRSGSIDYTTGAYYNAHELWEAVTRAGVEATLILPAGPDIVAELAQGLGAEPHWTWGKDARSGWVTATTGGRPPIHIGVRALAYEDPMIGPEVQSYNDVMVGLMHWYQATGQHYRQTPGVATLTTMGQIWRNRLTRRRLYNADTGDWWEPPTQLVDLAYGPAPDKLPAGLHRFDMRAAYLAAAASAYLPRGELVRTGVDGDPDAVGYFRVDGSAQVAGPYLASRRDRQGTVWVGSGTLRELRKRAVVTIHDSWTVDQGNAARIMRVWAEWYRDRIYFAEDARNGHLRAVLKAGYAQAFGVLATKRGSIYRPDWRHLIVDQAQASLLRRIFTVAELYRLHPAAVNHDSVWYDLTGAHQLAEVSKALGVGPRVGNMRYEGLSP